ncbi:FHA domain-containing protein [Thalassomonas viridans]|uniref:FHA domain-containing protein n=1 Tax=Thalassomonas viridans TaxID=137584 RepID=A0AAF0CCM7_9GAMM|nr:FHA domain-containing protein [Thalassomonas viridans]WDE08010.1 FHA domain-containing protein [Thalassomonas viridans]
MAILLNLTTRDEVNLSVQHVFGRHRGTSNTELTNMDASRLHATILWDGENWLLQDSSTNGTFVNGKLAPKGIKMPLSRGDKLNFGSLDADSWQLLNLDAPKSMLIPQTEDLPVLLLEDILVLPSEESPEITLYQSAGGSWICESSAGLSELKNGDLVGTQEHIWRFVETKPSEATTVVSGNYQQLTRVGMIFDVSQDEEHVALTVQMGEHQVNLEQRNHHYLLLLLARQRLTDKAAGLIKADQGWLDKEALSKMLKLSENHINIQIYRFRKQLISASPQCLALPQAIERRSGEIRIACDSIEINGGMQPADLNAASGHGTEVR